MKSIIEVPEWACSMNIVFIPSRALSFFLSGCLGKKQHSQSCADGDMQSQGNHNYIAITIAVQSQCNHNDIAITITLQSQRNRLLKRCKHPPATGMQTRACRDRNHYSALRE